METLGSSAARLVLTAFAVEAVLAGGNSVAIRFSNREFAPFWGAGMRFALGASLIVAVMAAMKLAIPRGRALMGALLFGLFQFAGAFGLYYYALVEIHAGLGQTLLALVPLATLVLAVVQGQERLRGAASVGTLIGLVAVGFISRDPLRESVPLLSLLAVLGSVLCFAQALVLIRRFPPIHPVVLNAVGMVVAAPVLIGVLPRSQASRSCYCSGSRHGLRWGTWPVSARLWCSYSTCRWSSVGAPPEPPT